MTTWPFIRCCRILSAGDDPRLIPWRKQPRRLPFHVLVLSLDGEEWIEVEGSGHRIPHGGSYLIAAGQQSTIGSLQGNRPVFVHFDLVHDDEDAARRQWRWFDDPLGQRMPRPQPHPGEVFQASVGLRPPTAIERQIRTRLPRLVARWRSGGALAAAQADNALESLLLAWAEAERCTAEHSGWDPERIARAEALALESLDHGFGVEAFAKAAGLARSRFHDLYRALRGEAPGDFLRRARLEAAQTLLSSGASLDEAASAAGFADRSAFSRAFRKATGQPPHRWRQLQDGTLRSPARAD